MHEFFSMGGYGWYVWSSYVAVALVLGVNVWRSLVTRKRLHEELIVQAQEQIDDASA